MRGPFIQSIEKINNKLTSHFPVLSALKKMLLEAFSAARVMVHVLLLHGNTKWRVFF